MRRILLCAGLILVLSSAVASADPGNYPKLALTNVLIAEGGYSNHPSDRGGRTLHGIIQRVYDADRAERGLPSRLIVPGLAKDAEFIEARDRIYKARYWEPCAGPALPRGLDFTVFSMCVNAGNGRGWSMLMGVLGLNAQRPYAPIADVLAAVDRLGVRSVIRLYGGARRGYYLALSAPGQHNAPFRAGWLSRETRETASALSQSLGTRQGATMPAPPGANAPDCRLRGSCKAVEAADELLEVMP